MINIIEKNKRLWMFYCTVLRALGWILLCMGGIGITLLIIEATQTGGAVNLRGTLGMLKRSNYIFINIGLVSLGVSQLVRYLCGNDNKMGPLLRYGDKIFYFYAIITVGQVGSYIWLDATGRMGSNVPLDLHWLILFLATLLYKGAKVLILVGLGKFLKYLVTVIKDSKQSSNTKTVV